MKDAAPLSSQKMTQLKPKKLQLERTGWFSKMAQKYAPQKVLQKAVTMGKN
jgi:hypothetical protein